MAAFGFEALERVERSLALTHTWYQRWSIAWITSRSSSTCPFYPKKCISPKEKRPSQDMQINGLYLAKFLIEIRGSRIGRCIGLWIIHISILQNATKEPWSGVESSSSDFTQLIKYAWINFTRSTVICKEIGMRLLKRMKKVKNV